MAFDQTYDWSLATNYSKFLTSFNEVRSIVEDGNAEGLPTSVAIGDDVQGYGLVNGMQGQLKRILNTSGGGGHFKEFMEPAAASSIGGSSITYSTTPPDETGSPSFTFDSKYYRAAQLSTATGIIDALKVAGCSVDTTSNSYDFTRKRGAEIDNLVFSGSAAPFNDTLDNAANTPAINDVARYSVDGQKYQLQSVSGVNTWVLLSAANQLVLQPRLLSGWGNMFAGDYFGPWIWNELAGVLNLLTVTREFGNFQTLSTSEGTGVVTGSSLTAAYSDASTNYTTSTNTTPGFGAISETYTTGSGGRAHAYLYRMTAASILYGRPAHTPVISRTLKFYSWTQNNAGMVDPAAAYKAFDTTPAHNTFGSLGTIGPDTAAHASLAGPFPSNTSPPPQASNVDSSTVAPDVAYSDAYSWGSVVCVAVWTRTTI